MTAVDAAYHLHVLSAMASDAYESVQNSGEIRGKSAKFGTNSSSEGTGPNLLALEPAHQRLCSSVSATSYLGCRVALLLSRAVAVMNVQMGAQC
jgi:hypothetical protein